MSAAIFFLVFVMPIVAVLAWSLFTIYAHAAALIKRYSHSGTIQVGSQKLPVIKANKIRWQAHRPTSGPRVAGQTARSTTSRAGQRLYRRAVRANIARMNARR